MSKFPIKCATIYLTDARMITYGTACIVSVARRMLGTLMNCAPAFVNGFSEVFYLRRHMISARGIDDGWIASTRLRENNIGYFLIHFISYKQISPLNALIQTRMPPPNPQPRK